MVFLYNVQPLQVVLKETYQHVNDSGASFSFTVVR